MPFFCTHQTFSIINFPFPDSIMKTKALKFSLLLVVAIVVVVGAARTSLGEQRMQHRRARRSGTLLTLKVNKIYSVVSLALQGGKFYKVA